MFGTSTATTAATTTQKDVEVIHPPDDTISCIIARAMQKHDAPILSCCWSDDGSKVFTASCDKTAKMWDLQSNTFIQIAAHDQPIRTIHYIQRPSYTCVMTGSWDRTGTKEKKRKIFQKNFIIYF
jgi:WD40 repeat protein